MDFLEKLEKGWPAIKGAPWQFAGTVLVVGLGIWLFLSYHYSSVIEGKDATIQAKEAVIQAKEETVIESQKALESIKQTLRGCLKNHE